LTGSRISRCSSCDEFFYSRRQLREHIDKNHRITDSKIPAAIKRVVDEKARRKMEEKDDDDGEGDDNDIGSSILVSTPLLLLHLLLCLLCVLPFFHR
jgi:uncharacterized C2H2 Zn-finger protein